MNKYKKAPQKYIFIFKTAWKKQCSWQGKQDGHICVRDKWYVDRWMDGSMMDGWWKVRLRMVI